jgi:hypothetical protein
VIARGLVLTWWLFLLAVVGAAFETDTPQCWTDAECEALLGPDEPCWGYAWECPEITDEEEAR